MYVITQENPQLKYNREKEKPVLRTDLLEPPLFFTVCLHATSRSVRQRFSSGKLGLAVAIDAVLW